MHIRIPNSHCRASVRRGFTLLELLIAISIIALLAGLLLVAVQGAIGAGDNAQVTNDIKQIEVALEAFKKEYGVYPPSSLVFDEDGDGTGTDVASPEFDAAKNEAQAFLARAFPLFATSVDLNGSGVADEVLFLDGAECLVLLLAGPPVRDASGNLQGFLGLSTNPTNPFSTVASGGRKQFLELDAARVTDIDGDGMPELLDTTGKQGTPFNYLRATPLGAYRPQGPDNIWGTSDDETLTTFPANDTSSPDRAAIVGPLLAYYQSAALGTFDVDGSGTEELLVPGGAGTAIPWKPNSFQIVWPGFDGQFGTGGEVANSDSARVANQSVNVTEAAGNEVERAIGLEADNVTNFLSGALGR